MVTVDTQALVAEKSGDLLTRPAARAWAACVSVWTRVFVLGVTGWAKRPELFAAMLEAFSLGIQRSTGADISSVPDLLIARLQAFDVEDDGSDEWQHMVDLIEMVTVAIDGHDIGTCVETSLRLYLEGQYIVMSNSYARSRPISVADADRLLGEDPAWARTVSFVTSL